MPSRLRDPCFVIDAWARFQLISLLRWTRRTVAAAGSLFLEPKIDCVARTVDAKENNILDRREGITMNRVSISQDEASRSRKILQRCMKHRVLYVIAKMTHKRKNLGEIYRRDGRRAKARRKDLSADTRTREVRKFNGNTVMI